MLLVFGSINLDIAFQTERLPAAGETVLGSGCLVSPGGKGANQAHAAALYGVPTQMVGAVGGDAFAEPALQCLRSAGVGLDALQRLDGATGCAGIAVDAQARNQIVVAPGVNLQLKSEHVGDALLAGSRALLLQMETDATQNLALLRRARAAGLLCVLNNAPCRDLGEEWLRALDVLIVNEFELERSARSVGLGGLAPEQAVATLAQRFGLTVVLTLGEQGLHAFGEGRAWALPALPVQAVDTTGAGDTFCGVFCAARVEGRALGDALARASVAAALACTQPGAQQAQPTRAQVEAALPAYFAQLQAAGTVST